MALNSIEELIEDIRQGKMVILMDDEDRENEGDFVMAAEKVTPEAINFMATHGRGLICLPMDKKRAMRLNLPLMVDNNNAQYSTAFTVSIEAAEGVTTGISAADRAKTVQAAVAPDAHASDLVQPGHIFPLIAEEGGVLTRAGHTEASCDLARLAGFESAAVIVEILNEDGTMARRPELEVLAKKQGIKMGTIADLIEYRNLNETTIERVAQCHLPTAYGEFELITYRDIIDDQLHFALVKGEVSPDEPTLVRVHLQSFMNDILLSDRAATRSWPLEKAFSKISEEGGVIVLLGREESNEELLAHLKTFEKEDKGEQPAAAKWQGTSRRVGIGSQILADLNVHKMRLLSSPKRYHALAGFGLEVVEYLPE
ncbi:bifunctional 3,4-dihydroxy-2-butanone-4-phosphate synthase/GTP cyclohydrolase II [Corallincola platygyrae]|uniref:3,4-dihydroxy-2-butanone 4-phosphate synthase n=1 Tax=Corallincola platygyrae TaxID=1193278 RepID=A0ABW4XSS2_9GAMM